MINSLLTRLGLRHTTDVRRPVASHGGEGIKAVGHREYVGGLWDEIGTLQFDLLLEQGLKPHHILLDVACGSLRGGRHFIPYLDRGNYLGIDKEESLIQAGIENELSPSVINDKQPEFVVSESFEFGKFSNRPNYAIAQSLFTHLPLPIIEMCLDHLRRFVDPGCIFYVTFFESRKTSRNPDHPHDHLAFRYTQSEMEDVARRYGWNPTYIGDWNHPRNQMLIKLQSV